MAIVKVSVPDLSIFHFDSDRVRFKSIYKKIGDEVTINQPLFDLYTRDRHVTFNSPASGILHSIEIKEGSEVETDQLLATIKTADQESNKMQLLFTYQKHYLELIKTYKEEIKFASTLQEDIRRERAQFFTQTLKEVMQTMKSAEIDPKISAQWLQELVDSYTKSLDLSADLAKTHVIEIVSTLTEQAKAEAAKEALGSV